MSERKIWRVPMFCMLISILDFIVNVYCTTLFIAVKNPDGTMSADPVMSLVVHGIVFLITVMIGYFAVHKMPRKDIFISASLMAGMELIFIIFQVLFHGISDNFQIFFMYLSVLTEWHIVVPEVFFRIGGQIGMIIGLFAAVLTPYIFVMFGKKSPKVKGTDQTIG